MKKDFGIKPWIYPQPVLMIATYDENGNPDIMNAAWGSAGDDAQVFLCLSPGHKTIKNILLQKEFTISIATEDYIDECDYLGITSGNDTPDKVAKSGLHVGKAKFVNAPVIDELPLCIECKLVSYEDKNCHLFGEIVNTSVDESVLTDGKLDPNKLKPLIFDIAGAGYYGLGKKLGQAFFDGLKLK